MMYAVQGWCRLVATLCVMGVCSGLLVPQTVADEPRSLPCATFDGLARAYAGAIDDEKIKLRVHVEHSGVALTNETISFIFEDNRGHDYGDGQPPKTAKFFDESGQLTRRSMCPLPIAATRQS